MDSSESYAESWLNIAQMDVQQEPSRGQNGPIQTTKAIEDPIFLFGQFVSAVSSDTLKDIRLQSEFSSLVKDLCIKAPSMAQYLVQEIRNHPNDDCQVHIQDSKKRESGTDSKQSTKRKQADRTYRPPKSGTQSDTLPEASGINTQIVGEPVRCQSQRDNVTSFAICEGGIPMVIAKEAHQEEVASQGEDYTMLSMSSESTLDQLEAKNSSSAKSLHGKPSVGLKQSTENSQTTVNSPSTSTPQPQKIVLPKADIQVSNNQAPSAASLPHRTELHQTALPDATPCTPIRHIESFTASLFSTPQTALFSPTRETFSPLTEDDRTTSPPHKVTMTLPEGIPSSSSSMEQQQTSLCNATSITKEEINAERLHPIQDSPAILAPAPSQDTPTLNDMVVKALDLLSKMSKCQEIPTGVHSRILTTIQPRPDGTPATTAVAGWLDSMWITNSSTTWSATMWIRMLEAGHARSKEATILNMIEWMGASEWYDAALKQAERAPLLTKRGKPRTRLATVVLDQYLKEVHDTTLVPGPEKLTSNEDDHSSSIHKRILDTRRKKLNKIFHRGRTLNRLVQKTHLGVLFDPNIWSYAKASKESIDKITASFRADQQKMELLSILGDQVGFLAKEGRPDLSHFFDSLELRSIIPLEEVSSLRAAYGHEREPVPQGCLNPAIERVVKGIADVLGKDSICEDDAVIVNGGPELSYDIFDKLRFKKWLNCWDIAAALEMTDRPAFVQLGLSIPLHRKDAEGEVTPISDPLRRWRKQIDDNQREDKNERPRVYICPLNVNANHFTLLEINEQTKMIYHYDSMASHGIIYRKTKSTATRRVIEAEFKELGLGYIEAPIPQQRDEWSCGLMVIRNAKRRMMGLAVGTWEDEVDPDRVIKEVVGDCQTFLEEGAFQPIRPSKKRKPVEGPQTRAPVLHRSSKRLKEGNGQVSRESGFVDSE